MDPVVASIYGRGYLCHWRGSGEKSRISAFLCAALASRPFWPPVSKEEMSGDLLCEATFRWRPQRGGRKRRQGVGSDGNRGDKMLLGECTGETTEHLGVQGSRTREHTGLRGSQGNLTCYCLVFFPLSWTLQLDFSSSNPSCNSPLTFLLLTLKLFIAFSSPAPPPTSFSLCNSPQRSVLRLFSWPSCSAACDLIRPISW